MEVFFSGSLVHMDKGKEKPPPKSKIVKKPDGSKVPRPPTKRKPVGEPRASVKHQRKITLVNSHDIPELQPPTSSTSESTNLEQKDEKVTAVGSRPLLAIMIWAISALTLIYLVWYLYHFLFDQSLIEAELEEKNLFTMETLIDLKSQTVQCNQAIYNILLFLFVIAGTVVIGSIVFFKDTSKHRARKAHHIATVATETLDHQTIYFQSQLNDQTLEDTLKKIKIEQYEDQIEHLQRENSRKDAEINALNVELKSMQKLLEETKSVY